MLYPYCKLYVDGYISEKEFAEKIKENYPITYFEMIMCVKAMNKFVN